MKLHGENVNVGDRVFDISSNRGFGQVIRVYPKLFEVKFGTISLMYNEVGVQKGRNWTTLYWHRPVIITPTKNENKWAAKQRIMQSFFEAIENYKELV